MALRDVSVGWFFVLANGRAGHAGCTTLKLLFWCIITTLNAENMATYRGENESVALALVLILTFIALIVVVCSGTGRFLVYVAKRDARRDAAFRDEQDALRHARAREARKQEYQCAACDV